MRNGITLFFKKFNAVFIFKLGIFLFVNILLLFLFYLSRKLFLYLAEIKYARLGLVLGNNNMPAELRLHRIAYNSQGLSKCGVLNSYTKETEE